MSWTILCPAVFVENFVLGFPATSLLQRGTIGLPPSSTYRLISKVAIGHFGAALTVLLPKDSSGRGISLAGDELIFGGEISLP